MAGGNQDVDLGAQRRDVLAELADVVSALSAASGWLFVAGILLFSGSLYLLALSGQRWLGAVTPLGHDVHAMFNAQLEGRSGVAPTRQFNASRFPTRFAADPSMMEEGRLARQMVRPSFIWYPTILRAAFRLPRGMRFSI